MSRGEHVREGAGRRPGWAGRWIRGTRRSTGRETNWTEDAHLDLELRAIASLSLILFFAVVVLWVFMFRGSPHEGLLIAPLGCFLGSWLSAVIHHRRSNAGIRNGDSRRSGLESSIELARYGFLAGMAAFVIFFLIFYAGV
ncbi:MAG: hypothetical protein AB1425_13725 [Actinomycetota bacterium]